jgi:hypothetical protein
LSKIGDMAEATDLERAPAVARPSAVRRTTRTLPGVEIQILIAIAILATTFSIAFPDSFATSGTLLNMARVSSIMLVVAIGQAFALIVGGFDISVGSTMGLVSIAVALLMKMGMDVPGRSGPGHPGGHDRRPHQRHWHCALSDHALRHDPRRAHGGARLGR